MTIDLVKQILSEAAEDLRTVLDNFADDFASHPDKDELRNILQSINFSERVLSMELEEAVDEETKYTTEHHNEISK